jgi:hypothetical protein
MQRLRYLLYPIDNCADFMPSRPVLFKPHVQLKFLVLYEKTTHICSYLQSI